MVVVTVTAPHEALILEHLIVVGPALSIMNSL